MLINSIDQLDDLSDDELWEVALDSRVDSEVRIEAMQRWLVPETSDPDVDPEAVDDRKLHKLQAYGQRLGAEDMDAQEEDDEDIEDMYPEAPYFDDQGRLIVDYFDIKYFVASKDASDSDDEDALDEATSE